MKKGLICAMLAACLIWSGDAFSRTTRDLVFEDDDAASEESKSSGEVSGTQTIGVKATVVLTRDGKTSTVAPSEEFKNGDKVKLVFTPSTDGYVYWLAKGTSGNYTMLYPSAKAGMDNAVKRNQEYTVPARGSFKFDEHPGNEELLCILSTERLNDLDKAAEDQFKNAARQVAELEKKQESKRTTRDLVFEDDEEEDVATKTQKGAKGEPFVAPFTLKHN